MYYKLRFISTQFVMYYKLRNYYIAQRNNAARVIHLAVGYTFVPGTCTCTHYKAKEKYRGMFETQKSGNKRKRKRSDSVL